jgi:hypothetical protein
MRCSPGRTIIIIITITIMMDPSQLPPEIFDMAIARLPTKDLLRCERVSKRWCDLIRDGSKTARTLFRYRASMEKLPDPKTRREFLEDTWNSLPTSSPIGPEAFIHCIAHPLLNRLVGLPSQHTIYSYCDAYLKIEREKLHILYSSDKKANPNASWRSMFITWPPLTEIKLQVHRGVTYGGLWIRSEGVKTVRVLSYLEGIKLNDFFYAIYSCGSKHHTLRPVSITDWIDTAPQN